MFTYIRRINLLFIIIFLTACSTSIDKINSIHNEILSENIEIECPNVKFIENLDRLNINRQNKNIYNVKFYEVKWKCYNSSDKNNADNIDLLVSFLIEYEEDIKDFQVENFSFIIALINEQNKIIVNKKFNRSFLSTSKTEILESKESLINIKVKNSKDQLYNHKLLLGFYQNIKDKNL